jgi:DNA-binding response OmpR family regulator
VTDDSVTMGDNVDPLAGVRVMAVDVDVQARERYGIELAMKGAFVHCPDSGTEALRNLRSFRPQIVVCDTTLPDMSGRVLVWRLRAVPSDVPVILLVSPDEADAGAEDSYEDFASLLQKPVNPAELARVIEGILQEQMER